MSERLTFLWVSNQIEVGCKKDFFVKKKVCMFEFKKEPFWNTNKNLVVQ